MERRDFLKALGGAALGGCLMGLTRQTEQKAVAASPGIWVNDIHTGLNPTRVDEIIQVKNAADIQNEIQRAAGLSKPICITGGRHAAGGQQFGTDSLLIDTQRLNRILSFDPMKGHIEVEAGIRWTDIMNYLNRLQAEESFQWGIKQKPTGSDRISLGGSVGANNHGRGLTYQPLISDVEAFKLIDANGQILQCSRGENPELFKLVLGGYGMFGIVYSVTLRLVERKKLRRQVQLMSVEEVYPAFQDAVKAGCLYGAFDFCFDPASEGYLRDGFFVTYLPVPMETPVSPNEADFSYDQWLALVYMIHQNKSLTYQHYQQFYQSTTGEVFWSDTAQLGPYKDYYHLAVDQKIKAKIPTTEAITEVYVPKSKLADFLHHVRQDFLKNQVDFIYGTVRFISQDTESFMPWAKGDFACIIFNLHIEQSPPGLAKARQALTQLIDRAIEQGGTYYLTYHRYASRQQVLASYPEFPEFLRLKHVYDPQERFQSDWYRHYRRMFNVR